MENQFYWILFLLIPLIRKLVKACYFGDGKDSKMFFICNSESHFFSKYSGCKLYFYLNLSIDRHYNFQQSQKKRGRCVLFGVLC